LLTRMGRDGSTETVLEMMSQIREVGGMPLRAVDGDMIGAVMQVAPQFAAAVRSALEVDVGHILGRPIDTQNLVAAL